MLRPNHELGSAHMEGRKEEDRGGGGGGGGGKREEAKEENERQDGVSIAEL